jgi:hypothetical protein
LNGSCPCQSQLDLYPIDDAFAFFAQSVQADPTDPRGYYNLSVTCERLGRISDAMTYLGKSLAAGKLSFSVTAVCDILASLGETGLKMRIQAAFCSEAPFPSL